MSMSHNDQSCSRASLVVSKRTGQAGKMQPCAKKEKRKREIG